MLISDWSSDVCSSDLIGTTTPKISRAPLKNMIQPSRTRKATRETISTGTAQLFRSTRPRLPIKPANVPIANAPVIQLGIEEAAARSASLSPAIGSPKMPTELRYMATPNAFQRTASSATIRNQVGGDEGNAAAMIFPPCCERQCLHLGRS